MRMLVLLVLLGVALAAPNSPQRISGGQDALIQDYKFMAVVKIGALVYTYHCSAVLISNTIAISTADPVKSVPTITLRLGVGSSSSGGLISGSSLKIDKVVVHPNFNKPKLSNDLSIFFLSDRATQSHNVGYARMAGASYNVADGTSVVALGWGSTKEPGWIPDLNPNSETLKKVTLKIVNHEECKSSYRYLKDQPFNGGLPDIDKNMICAAMPNESKGSCKGDEGGALIAGGDIMIGAYSFNYRCGDPKYASVYTRISEFASWILKETS